MYVQQVLQLIAPLTLCFSSIRCRTRCTRYIEAVMQAGGELTCDFSLQLFPAMKAKLLPLRVWGKDGEE